MYWILILNKIHWRFITKGFPLIFSFIFAILFFHKFKLFLYLIIFLRVYKWILIIILILLLLLLLLILLLLLLLLHHLLLLHLFLIIVHFLTYLLLLLWKGRAVIIRIGFILISFLRSYEINHFRKQFFIWLNYFCEILPSNAVCWNIWRFKFETAIYIDVILNDPWGMSKSLYTLEFRPFRCLCVINFHSQSLYIIIKKILLLLY